jgi:uncharacterized membrane protein YidH (DUF202 family)
MKKAGIALLIVGLLLIVFTGFKYFTREKVVDVGSLEITASRPHHVNWSPYVGVGIMIAGGVILLAGKKK